MRIFEDRPCVLVVEDEPDLAMVAHELVEEAGFRAVTAGSAEEAIRKIETRADVVAVFADVRLPGESGLQLATRLRERWPQLRILLTSGKVQPHCEDMPCVFLPKPYSADGVKRALDALTRH